MPTTKKATLTTYVPPELYKKLKALAEKNERSISKQLELLLKDHFKDK